jgi:hypothetical protein
LVAEIAFMNTGVCKGLDAQSWKDLMIAAKVSDAVILAMINTRAAVTAKHCTRNPAEK